MITKDKTLVAFGKHLMELRKEKGFSQEELANRCELNRNYVGSIERAEKTPSLTTLLKLADGLGVTRAELLEFKKRNMEQQIIIQTPVSLDQFSPVVNWIRDAQHQVYSYANRALIDLYWQIGQYLSEQTQNGGWGKSVVKSLSEYIQQTEPGAEGFSSQNLWRMKQFYETYCGNEKLSTLLRDLSWSNNLLIMNRCKTDEEREYQLQLPDKKLLQAKMQELFQHQN